jgi:hypothetical protein
VECIGLFPGIESFAKKKAEHRLLRQSGKGQRDLPDGSRRARLSSELQLSYQLRKAREEIVDHHHCTFAFCGGIEHCVQSLEDQV